MAADGPGLGVGVIIEKDGLILVGRRIGSHGPGFSIPGGKIDLGERFEQAAVREVAEEVGVEIAPPRVLAVINDLATWRAEGVHFASVVVHAPWLAGEPQNLEPHKCEGWAWVDPKALPQPHFRASELAVRCFLDGVVTATG